MPQKEKTAPLPCFALEFNRHNPTCQSCPHYAPCEAHMGSRRDKVALDKVQFNLWPDADPSLKLHREAFDRTFDADDPELPHLQRLYADCYQTVFGRNALDNISREKDVIAANARESKCSIRMFMLANMVAHTEHQKAVIANTEKDRASRFTAKLLTTPVALKRAATYQAMCHDRYGTFTLSSLATLEDDGDKQDIETIMLNSEVTAARWLVRHKITTGGPAEADMYDSIELQLAPEWLATEPTYLDLILRPYIQKTLRGSEQLQLHRFNVYQTHAHYKKHLSAQRLVLIARQRIMPEAVRRVLGVFNVKAEALLYPRTYTGDAMGFWRELGLTLRHYHCWLYLNDAPSLFTPRRNPVKEVCS